MFDMRKDERAISFLVKMLTGSSVLVWLKMRAGFTTHADLQFSNSLL